MRGARSAERLFDNRGLDPYVETGAIGRPLCGVPRRFFAMVLSHG